MRTKIAATWIVAHERGKHVLIRDGEVVFEGNTHPACRQGLRRPASTGPSMPRASWWRLASSTRTCIPGTAPRTGSSPTPAGPMYYGQPFLEISVPKEGKVVKGDPRYLKHGDAGSDAAFELNAAVHGRGAAAQRRDDIRRVRQPAERAGRTAGGGDAARQPAPTWRPATTADAGSATTQGRLERVRNDALGLEGLAARAALDREATTGRPAGRVRGILVPREVETCEPRRAADARCAPPTS